MGNRKVKVAAIQTICKINNKEANVLKALRMIDEAAEDGSKIILLQESFFTEFACFLRRDFNVFSYAEPIPGPTIKRMAKKAREHGVYIIAPIFEKVTAKTYYNTAAVIDPLGNVIGKYRKTHIPGGKFGSPDDKTGFTTNERFYFKPGSPFPVFKTEFGDFGILMCYDRQFPECWRILALRGAEVIFVAASAPDTLQPVWELVPKAMAFQNGVFAVLANRVGNEGSVEYFGGSLIVSPRGKVLKKAKEKGDVIVSTTLDLEEVRRARMIMPMLRDRRPDIYGSLVGFSNRAAKTVRTSERNDPP
ncbi:hypothetical protein A2W24_03840 [Microgenomates group bacterium RBG_16_45_19]|nr:MAG: hypothetical protein A2W24_03840 [Microgenomates group bacterium RBG_16_45_19]